MKKTLCWLIVLAMLVVMAPAAFAAEQVQDMVLLEETVTFETYDAAFWGEEFFVDAPGTGTVTITFPENSKVEFLLGTITEFEEDCQWYNPSWGDALTQTAQIEEGEQIKVTVCALNEACDDYGAGEISFTLTFTGTLAEAEGGEGNGDEELSTVLAVGDNTMVIEGGAYDSAEYTFTATENGTVTVTVDAMRFNTIYDESFVNWEGDFATEFPLMLSVNGEAVEANSASVEVAAGDEVTVMLTQNRMYVNNGYGWEANLYVEFAAAAGEGGEVVGDLIIGDNEFELPMGASEPTEHVFVATETCTLYIAVVDFLYSASWTDGAYEDNNDFLTMDWFNTTFTVNGVELEGGYYGAVEVVAGEAYTFSWAHKEDGTYGYMATINLSYTDELIPVPGIDMPLTKDHLPTESVVIPAEGEVLYRINYSLNGYILTVTGENAYIRYSFTDQWSGETKAARLDAVNGVVEYSLDEHGSMEIYIGNTGAEDAVFQLDCYAPAGSAFNPIQVENLEDITTTIPAQWEGTVYFQWEANKLGTIIVTPGNFNFTFENMTKDEYGQWIDNWNRYSVYAEPGDIVLIGVGGWLEEETVFTFTYEFVEGYREGSEQNPMVVDLVEGLSMSGLSNETVYYSWTPTVDAVIELNLHFISDSSWMKNVPTITINGEPYNFGTISKSGEVLTAADQLTVTAGEPLIICVTATKSVYSTMKVAVIEELGSAVVLGDANNDGEINYLDAMLIAQYYVGDIEEDALNLAAGDVNKDGEVDYLDAMQIAQFYVGDIDSFEP